MAKADEFEAKVFAGLDKLRAEGKPQTIPQLALDRIISQAEFPSAQPLLAKWRAKNTTEASAALQSAMAGLQADAVTVGGDQTATVPPPAADPAPKATKGRSPGTKAKPPAAAKDKQTRAPKPQPAPAPVVELPTPPVEQPQVIVEKAGARAEAPPPSLREVPATAPVADQSVQVRELEQKLAILQARLDAVTDERDWLRGVIAAR